jgi:F-type H+-transporting ATPase subunit delta
VAREAQAKRYAQAVFQIALEKGEPDRWQSDLKRIASLEQETVLVRLLESPKVPFGDKVRLLSERLADINPLALNLACLLVARGRLGLSGEIAEEYQRLLDSYRGIEPAEVITAVPLEDEDKQKLEERLSDVAGKKVIIYPKVDPAVVGGIVARFGGKLLDGSTRNRLEALKKDISGRAK